MIDFLCSAGKTIFDWIFVVVVFTIACLAEGSAKWLVLLLLTRTYVALVLVVNSFGGSNLELNDT